MEKLKGLKALDMHQTKRNTDKTLIVLMITMFISYFFIHALLPTSNGGLLGHNSWDSYTLQSLAWLRGKVSLGHDYSWLELAVFNNDWYVSFPPFPSVVMLPFAILFGEATPNNLIIAGYAMVCVALAYKILRHKEVSEVTSAIIALFVVWGSNMFWMSTCGGVWFQAQALNMLFALAAVYCCMLEKRGLSYAFLAMAVGCRPFSLCYFPVLFIVYYMRDYKKEVGFFKTLLKQLKPLIPAVAIGIAYMLYNFVRFGSPLEFGHNYLPEFTQSENGQFSLVYLAGNLKNLFLRPVGINSDLTFDFSYNGEQLWFNGFLFYIVNPIFLLTGIYAILDIIKKKMSLEKVVILVAMMLNILLLCCHKTLGGWQFGARYTCDLIPFAFMYIAFYRKWQPKSFEYIIMAFGIMFNLYGIIAINYLQ